MLFRNATPADGWTVDVRVAGERVTAVESQLSAGDEQVVDAAGVNVRGEVSENVQG